MVIKPLNIKIKFIVSIYLPFGLQFHNTIVFSYLLVYILVLMFLPLQLVYTFIVN